MPELPAKPKLPHPVPPARWPTREEARASVLFSPIRIGALTSRTRRGAAIDELPGHHPVEDVGAWLDAEHGIVELNVAASLGVEGLNLDLHRLAFLALVGGGRFAFSL